ALRQIPKKDEEEEILEFLENVKKITGFLPFIVLTNKIRGDADKLRSQFEQFGMEKIFEVENYTAENHVKSPEKEKTFLTILKEILDYVDFVANVAVPTMDSPEVEHEKRQQMILKVAHDNDVERKKKQWLAENKPPEKKARWPCNVQ
ncbi:unnamed protein product, partial [Ranitomeya imitator]